MIVELDTEVVVSFLSSYSKIHPKLWALVITAGCCCGAYLVASAKVHHAFREANKSADALASLGRTQDDDFVIFFIPQTLLLFGVFS